MNDAGPEARGAPSRRRLLAGSLAFWAVFAASVVLWSLPMPAFVLIPYRWRYAWVRSWCRFNLWALRVTCGMRYRVEGAERIPRDRPVVVLCKHQSTWETVALQLLLPPVTYVLKRELLLIPFFGWGLAVMRPIAIDRASGRRAVEQLLRQGRRRLEQGIGVVVFPEGTRTAPGSRRRYKLGGAILATRTGTPVLPIALNSGELWPRHSLVKWPGTVRVVIGPPTPTAGRDPEAVMAEAREWIEAEVARISDPVQRARIGRVAESRAG